MRYGDLQRIDETTKPFSAITLDEVVGAIFDTADISMTMYSWWSVHLPETFPDIYPKSSAELTPEQRRYLAGQLEAEYRSVITDLAAIADKSIIPVRRIMRRLDMNQLGRHWSYDLGNKFNEIFGDIAVYGEVANNDVDWLGTIARGMFHHHEEAEISVRGAAPIAIRQIVFHAKHLGRA